jgi:Bacterial PH domain
MWALVGHLNGSAIRMQPEQGQGAGRPDGKAAGQRAGQAVAASPPAKQAAQQPGEQSASQSAGQSAPQPAAQRVQQPAEPGVPGGTTASRLPGGKTGQPADQKVFRLPGSVVFWWAWVIFAVACLVDIAFTGHNHTAAEIAVTVVFITGVIYACALRPRVIADADAITVQNPLRDHRIPWGSVTTVDLRESVQVHCAKEPGAKRGKVVHSWALYAHRRQRLRQELLSHGNDRRRLPRSALNSYGQPSDAEQKKPSAAQLMATQLDELASQARERGAAAGPSVVTWPWPPAAAIAAPAIALILVITLFH